VVVKLARTCYNKDVRLCMITSETMTTSGLPRLAPQPMSTLLELLPTEDSASTLRSPFALHPFHIPDLGDCRTLGRVANEKTLDESHHGRRHQSQHVRRVRG
jgi:hypothetical protein